MRDQKTAFNTSSVPSWDEIRKSLLEAGMYEFDVDEVRERLRSNLADKALEILVEIKGKREAGKMLEQMIEQLLDEDLTVFDSPDKFGNILSQEEKERFSKRFNEEYQKLAENIIAKTKEHQKNFPKEEK